MKLKQVRLENFQSYKKLSFNYDDLGLCLISGPTGAGKSTLMDAPLWILFGQTGKDSTAKDVLAWGSDEPTTGELTLEYGNEIVLNVFRSRAKNAIKNDFFFGEPGSPPIRGINLQDTQRLLNEKLGISLDLCLYGSYMTQFSETSNFFQAKAKDRRLVFDKIADQAPATAFLKKLTAAKSKTKEEFQELKSKIDVAEGSYSTLLAVIESTKSAALAWEENQSNKIDALNKENAVFKNKNAKEINDLLANIEVLQTQHVLSQKEALQKLLACEAERKERQLAFKTKTALDAELLALDKHLLKAGKCPTCGSDKDAHSKETKALMDQRNSLAADILVLGEHIASFKDTSKEEKEARDAQAAHLEVQMLLKRVEDLKAAPSVTLARLTSAQQEKNVHKEKLVEYNGRLDNTKKQLSDLKALSAKNKSHLGRLEWLLEAAEETKGAMVKAAVQNVQNASNELIDRYFDAALKINFQIEEGDTLAVTIYNNDHECPYSQLSGGERGILRIAFGVALMQACQNNAGVFFDTIMLDEAMNGLDEELKTRAYDLLLSLSAKHTTVLVVEHSEQLKQQFSKTFEIVKENGVSFIQE